MSTGGTTAIFQIVDDEEFDLSFEVDDKAGNVTTLDPASVVDVAVSDPTILTITNTDPTHYTISSTGKIGSSQVSVKASINGTDIVGSLNVDVVAGAADHLTLTPSAPRKKA